MQDWRLKLIEAGVMLVVVAVEYWAMQPYHKPLLASFWLWLAKLCQRVAGRFGMLGLVAEHNYYEAI